MHRRFARYSVWGALIRVALLGLLSGGVARAQVAYSGPQPPPYGATSPQTYPTPVYWPPASAQDPPYWAIYPRAAPPAPADRGADSPERRGHRFTATMSVVHPLVVSIFDLTGEFRAGKRGGIAVLAGYGSVPLRILDKALPDERAKVYMAGAQVRGYPVGSFEHGLVLGFDASYFQGSGAGTAAVTTDDENPMPDVEMTVKGSGFKIGPFAGYKLVLPVGLSFDAAIGIEYLSVNALGKSALGQSRSASLKIPLLLLNGGVGWSF